MKLRTMVLGVMLSVAGASNLGAMQIMIPNRVVKAASFGAGLSLGALSVASGFLGFAALRETRSTRSIFFPFAIAALGFGFTGAYGSYRFIRSALRSRSAKTGSSH